jgi:hypothetical protein
VALIDDQYIKDRFPAWEKYCTIKDSTKTPEEVLDIVKADSEVEFLDYLDVDETTITDAEKLLLLKIVRYRSFLIRHGDTEFKNTPEIVKEYEATLEFLKGNQSEGQPAITAKARIFTDGGWFTE